MFNYFGTKRQIAKYYPKPRYPKIIEPFAGAAGYSVLHHTHQVWLNDVDPIIAMIWRWIIQAKPDEIDALPDLKQGEHLDSFRLAPPQRHLIANCLNKTPCWSARQFSPWAGRQKPIPLLKKRLHAMTPQICHWQVTNYCYQSIPNQEATWFVDAPYQKQGESYKYHKIDYADLAEWCKSRKGQVIVCESDFAEWLPFKVFIRRKTRGWQTECIWTNDTT